MRTASPPTVEYSHLLSSLRHPCAVLIALAASSDGDAVIKPDLTRNGRALAWGAGVWECDAALGDLHSLCVCADGRLASGCRWCVLMLFQLLIDVVPRTVQNFYFNQFLRNQHFSKTLRGDVLFWRKLLKKGFEVQCCSYGEKA